MTEGVNPDHLYTLEAIEGIILIKKRTLQRLCSEGKIKSTKKHKRYYVLGQDLIDYLTKE